MDNEPKRETPTADEASEHTASDERPAHVCVCDDPQSRCDDPRSVVL